MIGSGLKPLIPETSQANHVGGKVPFNARHHPCVFWTSCPAVSAGIDYDPDRVFARNRNKFSLLSDEAAVLSHKPAVSWSQEKAGHRIRFRSLHSLRQFPWLRNCKKLCGLPTIWVSEGPAWAHTSPDHKHTAYVGCRKQRHPFSRWERNRGRPDAERVRYTDEGTHL